LLGPRTSTSPSSGRHGAGARKGAVRASPQVLAIIRTRLPKQVEDLGEEEGGWHRAALTFSTVEEARTQLLAYGGGVEALEPLSLRLSIEDFARQTLRAYVLRGAEKRK